MAQERDPRVEQLKQELKPLMKRANQRLLRLEHTGLTDSHGYRAVQNMTAQERPRFGTRNKSLEELQDQKQRILNFLDYKSSTVRGAMALLSTYADKMRVPFADDPNRMLQESGKFFRLSNYVKQYIRNTSQERHISSDEVFMGISRAVDAGDINLEAIDFDDFDLSMEQMESIVRRAGGNSRNDLFEDLGNVQYKRSVRVKAFDPNDF